MSHIRQKRFYAVCHFGKIFARQAKNHLLNKNITKKSDWQFKQTICQQRESADGD
jgi:hypothetical protein